MTWGDHPVPPVSTIHRRPVADALDELADLLAAAAGRKGRDRGRRRSRHSDAVDEVVALAEALGAPVHGAPLYGRGVFPPLHALWAGMLAPAAAA